MAKSKFFRVAVAGFTASDGRKIEEEWINDIVDTFNSETYTPRISCEHIRGFSPEPPFNAYGDVAAVKKQYDNIVIDGQTERRLALYAQIVPNDQLRAVNKKDQKKFTSIEVVPDFGGTGKFGLGGLGITDNPASLGTEALSFSGLKPMFDARKQNPANFFTAAIEANIELEPEASDSGSIADAIKAGFAGVAAMFSRSDERQQPKEEPKQKPANDNGFDMAAFTSAMGEQVAAAIKPVADNLATLQGNFDRLKTKLETTEQTSFSRSTASGGDAQHLTDC